MERQHITQIKSISIESYLESQGMKPAKVHGQKLYYHSPFRTDSTPSFVVNLDSNTYKDFAEDEKPEDIIRLVERLHKFSFKEACQHLHNWTNTAPPTPFLSNGKEESANGSSSITVIETKPLVTTCLLEYLKSRKINAALSYLYLTEIIYENKGKRYRGIGFKNISGGYEIKDGQGRKYSIRPKSISYIPVKGSKTVSVFEGFIDFLSALMYCNLTKSKYSVIVLNSTSNLTKSLPIVSQYECINAYLDNDEAGKKALSRFLDNGIKVNDCSKVYKDYKDFNEFWQNQGKL